MRRGLGVVVALGVLATAAEARAQCVGRPTDPGGFGDYDYAPAEVKSFAGTKVRVHYTTSGPHAPVATSTRDDGVPDSVANAVAIGDKALGQYESMGFNAIPSDEGCTSNGGDAKVDIYLVKFASADGSAQAECNGGQCSSFALVESTFQGRAYPSLEEGFRTVIAHELFHAVQKTYKPRDAAFWAEGTAQWAMKKVYPELVDFERSLRSFFADPARSIDAPPAGVTAGFLYGSSVWPLFLSLRHGDTLVRDVFVAEEDGTEPLVAIDAVLKTKGSSLAAEYPLFAAWNVGTGKQASTGGYPDAAKYPGIATESLTDGLSGATSGLGYHAYVGTLAEEQNIALETDQDRNGGVVVPIVDDVLQLGSAKALPANASGTVLVVVSGVTTRKTDARYTIRLGAPVAEPAPDAGTPPSSVTDDGGCQTAPGSGSGAWALPALALLFLRRRRS